MRKAIWLILVILPVTCLGQSIITGRVINLSDKKPISNASVFLSNATAGTATAADGSFTLNNVRNGQYDLVVSIVGFETYHQTVLVNKPTITLPAIELIKKITALREVSIKPDPNWDFYYQTFKRYFIGTSENAAKCKILNPEVLDFNFDAAKRILNASTPDFLVIENNALGYRIKYLLSKFTNSPNEGMTYFEGAVLLQELRGSASQRRRWAKRRAEVYMGSTMHFLRSIIANQVTEQGFKVLRLIRKPNPAYKGGINDRYLETLVNVPLTNDAYAKLTDIPGVFALDCPDCLYVMYTRKRDINNANVVEHFEMPNFATSIISFNKPYVLFDKNGVFLNPVDIVFEGSWTKNLVAEMLPVDYELPPR